MRVGIVLDNPQRDLTGVCLIAYHLVRQGHSAFIVPMYDQGYDVPWLDLDGVIVNYARTSNLEFLKAYKKLGLTVCVLDTEGGLMPESGDGSPVFWAKRIREIGAVAYIDRYMFWGRGHYEAMREHSGIGADKLQVTGSPRHDACHPKWRPILRYPRTGFVLVNLNFPSVNPWWGKAHYSAADDRLVFESARVEMDNLSRVVEVDFEKAYRLQDEIIRTLNEYVGVIRGLAARNPTRPFVVRPHPFENSGVYRAYFARSPNVTVDGSGEAFNVINAADFILHLNCGTSVETRLLGKTPISLEFLNSETIKLNVVVPSAISFPARDVEEVDRLIKRAQVIPPSYQDRQSYWSWLEPWFREVDGKAGERVADVVLEALQGRRPQAPRARMRYSVSSCFHSPGAKHLAQGVVAQFVGSRWLAHLRNRINRQRRMKYVTPAVLKQRIDQIAVCDGQNWACVVSHARHPLSGAGLVSLRVTREPRGRV